MRLDARGYITIEEAAELLDASPERVADLASGHAIGSRLTSGRIQSLLVSRNDCEAISRATRPSPRRNPN